MSTKGKTPNIFSKILIEIVDLVSFFIMALGIVFFIRLFIFSPFTVVGQSMEPTLHDGDFLIVDKLSSLRDKISTQHKVGNILPDLTRGDVIVFIPPQQTDNDKYLVKRIVGLPGDTVKIEDNKISICPGGDDCKLLDEPYLKQGETTLPDRGLDTFVITGGYFVMGDNRHHSTDSRACFMGVGCYEGYSYTVPYDNVIGRVRIRLSPDYTRF